MAQTMFMQATLLLFSLLDRVAEDMGGSELDTEQNIGHPGIISELTYSM